MKLNESQAHALAFWWRYKRPGLPNCPGYDPHVIWEKKPTLTALERRGLVAMVRPHYLGGWCATVTDAGAALAEQVAADLVDE